VPNSRLPVIAIYLGYRGGHYHFYISTGKWRFSPTYTSYFSLSGFVDRRTVDAIMAHIPADASAETYIRMEKDRLGPPRQAAGRALDRLNEFQQRAQAVYQENISVLDHAFDEVAHQDRFRYMSLFEVASRLLPTADGELAPTALYAVHLALMRVDGGFRPVADDSMGHKRDYVFEVSPRSYRDVIARVEGMTREYTQDRIARVEREDGVLKGEVEDVPGGLPLARFVRKARAYVARSRAVRDSTPHAVVGPYKSGGAAAAAAAAIGPIDEHEGPVGEDAADASSAALPPWSDTDRDVIHFIEMWAAHRVFSPGSSLNAIASLILRYTNCYAGELDLGPSVGWLFLQEIGRVPPWELPSRFRHRLPETTVAGGGHIRRDAPDGVATSLRADVAEGRRREWHEPVFCIDSKSTTLIDDGISLERTATDACWLHVHVADPTSGILPKSHLARYMEALPENVWVPGFLEEMLPPALATKYSITNGSPSLTFSALLSPDGRVLETAIAPGTLRNVVYLETSDVFGFCGYDEHARPSEPLAVGPPPPPKEAERGLTPTRDLPASHAEDLRAIARLADVLQNRRIADGALSGFPPTPTVSVSLDATAHDAAAGRWTGDPHIEIDWATRDDVRVVASPMQLAGEIAARWCHDRGVPIPYRRETDSLSPPARDEARAYIRDELTPQLMGRHTPLTPLQMRRLVALLGAVVDSPVPGPFVKMGLDMYTRTTSPLRRFVDMLVHWQIHAALALETRLGRRITPDDVRAATAPPGMAPSLTPGAAEGGKPSWADAARGTIVPQEILDDPAAIPYSAEDLGPLLSLTTMRSRLVRRIHTAEDEWILHAIVRAWKYPSPSASEAGAVRGSLPATFEFRVSDVGKHSIVGRTPELFGRTAVMSLAGLGGVARLAEIKEGDVFEVEIEDVNVHSRIIHVRALRRV
jgi:hypothetical protein